MMVKMTQDLGNRMEKRQEIFTKDLEELKNKHTEMNNILEGISSRTTEAEASGTCFTGNFKKFRRV